MGISPDRSFVEDEREGALRLISPALPMFRHAAWEHPENVRVVAGGHADVVQGIVPFAGSELSLSRGAYWCDSPDTTNGNPPYYVEEQWTEMAQKKGRSLLMASGKALEWAEHNTELQVANPGVKWRLNPCEPPFTDFRDVMHLVSLWVDTIMEEAF